MKKAQYLLSFTSFVLLASCVTTTEDQRIVTEQHFRDVAVEKTLKNNRANVIVRLTKNGLLEGTEPAGVIKGTWNWDGSRFCRQVTTGPLTGESCQVVTIKDNNITFKDVEGKIRTVTYSIVE